MSIIGNLIFSVIIGFLISLVWVILECIVYKEPQPRVIDDIMVLIFMIVIFVLRSF